MPGEPRLAPPRALRVLHVEDSEDDSVLIMRELRRGGFDPSFQRVYTRTAFKEALRTQPWDVIISDHSLPEYNGMTALADMRATGSDTPFILVSGTIGEAGAVNAMRAGAQDYILKDNLSRLPLVIEREMREAELRDTRRKLTEQLAISERMASAGVLAAGVAHEINNPLAVIMANLDFLTSLVGNALPKSKEADGSLDDAKEAAERIRVIVRDMKLFARPQLEEREAIDVRSVIESSIRMAWNEIRYRARIIKEFGEVPLADTHEARLGQIILNLLVNAAQAMPEGRASANQIRVVTKTGEDGRVVIEVHDSGMGIPKHNLKRIFDPFFTTKAVGVGTGLGLSLCQRMVTDLGGEIAVESEIGRGALFRVTLPAAKSAPRAALVARAAVPPARRGRVLVVDDEPGIGHALQRSLGRYHDVVNLTSGREALTLIAAGERFDAIISDLMMPDVTGMEIHAELIRLVPEQAKKMIFLTGGAFTQRATDFLDSVSNPRAEKPFEVAGLLACIAAVIEQPGS